MKHSLRDFNPHQVAKLETQMWKSYYSHSFLKLGVILVRLFREQFHVNWLVAIQLGIYSGRASSEFRRTGDQEKTKSLLMQLYRTLEKHAKETFDSEKAAGLELTWWLRHRYPDKSQKSLGQTLAEAMAVLYGIKPSTLMKYAEHRAKAMGIRDKATHETKSEPDWRAIENELLSSYSALKISVD